MKDEQVAKSLLDIATRLSDLAKEIMPKSQKVKDLPGQQVLFKPEDEQGMRKVLNELEDDLKKPEEKIEEGWQEPPGKLDANEESKRKIVPLGKAREMLTTFYECECGCDKLVVSFFDSYGPENVDSKCTRCGKEERFLVRDETEFDGIIEKGQDIIHKPKVTITLGDIGTPSESKTDSTVKPGKKENKAESKGTVQKMVDADGEEVFVFTPHGKTPEVYLSSEQEQAVQKAIMGDDLVLDARKTREEMKSMAMNWPKEKIVKKYEELTQTPWNDKIPESTVLNTIVDSLLGFLGNTES